MELQELQNLLNQLLRAVQLTMQSGEELPDEMQGQIAQTLQLLLTRIEQLSATEPPTEPTQAQPEKLYLSRPFPSSNVHSFGYDDKNGTLYVRFQDKFPGQNGPVYQYQGVPQDIFELFRKGSIPAKTQGRNDWGEWWVGKVPSLGASLYALIKNGGYPYQRVS